MVEAKSGEISYVTEVIGCATRNIFNFPVPLTLICCSVHVFLHNTHNGANKKAHCLSFILFKAKLFSDIAVTSLLSSLSDRELLSPLHHPLAFHHQTYVSYPLQTSAEAGDKGLVIQRREELDWSSERIISLIDISQKDSLYC